MSRVSIYREKFLQSGYVIGAFASVWSVIIAIWVQFWSLSWWIGIPSAVVLLSMSISVVAVWRSESTTRLFRINDWSGNRKYLYQWINEGGRVAIWTRDMSWANDPEMDALLTRKAQAKELIVCLPRDIAKSNELKAKGAEVIAYGTIDATESRFTIVNYGQAGSRVAVGRPSGSLHVIQEYSEGKHPAFHMAEDLVRLVRERNNAGE